MADDTDQDTMVQLTMPYIKFEYSAKSEQRKRASGIQFMLLKMIGYAEQVSENLKIKDVMSIFSISVDLAPFIAEEIAQLARTEMVDLSGISVDRLSGDTPMRFIRINKNSRDLYETGFVRSRLEDMHDTLLFFPMRREMFQRSVDMQSVDISKIRLEVDTEELGRYLHRIRPDSEITDVTVLREKKDKDGTVIVQGPKLKGYRQKVYLYFNMSEGCFEVDAERSGVDIDKMRARFKGDSLLRGLGDDVFILGNADGLEINGWGLEPPEGVRKRILPKDFRVMKGLFFYGSRVRNSNPLYLRMPDGLGCDALLITDAEHVCRYWFSRSDVTVKGFEGSKKNQNMVYFQPIASSETVKACVREAISGLKLPGDLDTLNRISSAAHDPSIFADTIVARISAGSRDIFMDTLNRIGKMSPNVWKTDVENGLEDLLCKRITEGADLDYVKDFCTICSDRGFMLAGNKLTTALLGRYDLLDLTDWSLSSGVGGKVLLSDDALPKEAMDAIDKGRQGVATSDLVKTVYSASAAFSDLKEKTGISEPTGYSFDLQKVTPETAADIQHDVTALYGAVEILEKELPGIKNTRAYAKISNLRPAYESLSYYCRSKKTKWPRSDLKREENPLLFCTVLSRKLRQALTGLGVRDLEELASAGRIDPGTKDRISEFLSEAGTICTSDIGRRIPADSRELWTDAVLSLEEIS